MAKAFDVTMAASAITLDDDRKATITVTTTSVLTRPVRGRFKVKPTPPAAAEWFKVQADATAPATPAGEIEREFAVGATHPFVVNVAVPADVAAGVYNVAFLLEAEDNTDVDFDLSSAVAVTVPAKKEVKKPFPWKIPVAILLVLVLAAAAVVGIRALTKKDEEIAVDVPEVTQPTVTVANFFGDDALAATTEASRAGLAVRLESVGAVAPNIGKVIGQSLGVGQTVPNGTTITLQVGVVKVKKPITDIPAHAKIDSILNKTVSDAISGK